jgi:hypothetical protein
MNKLKRLEHAEVERLVRAFTYCGGQHRPWETAIEVLAQLDTHHVRGYCIDTPDQGLFVRKRL